MFTGIIETTGTILSITDEGTNKRFGIEANILSEIKIDQSIAHNGACLTVEKIKNSHYEVVAIQETLSKTNLGKLKIGDSINLERCMIANGRFDGHIVQGHVDEVGKCTKIENQNGSWVFSFAHGYKNENITVEKGSICVNGVSLTVINSKDGAFSVAIIPYTYENTNFHKLRVDDVVNLEFDIIGKYVKKLLGK